MVRRPRLLTVLTALAALMVVGVVGDMFVAGGLGIVFYSRDLERRLKAA